MYSSSFNWLSKNEQTLHDKTVVLFDTALESKESENQLQNKLKQSQTTFFMNSIML